MQLSPQWAFIADTVMGGVSQGDLRIERVKGRNAARLTGQVSLENGGGFIQMASNLSEDEALLDASGWTGIEIEVRGNGETYELRLRTDALMRPRQSYKVEFKTTSDWQALRFPFESFEAHRTDERFDPARLRRLGIVAIGREFFADVAVAEIRLFK